VRNANACNRCTRSGCREQGNRRRAGFFLSLTGYGLWADTFSDASFDLNVTDPARIRINVRARKLRFVIFEGPQFPKILERFTALVGRSQLPPYWAFAPWKARDYHRNQAEVYEDIDRYRQLGLPASVILIDSPWATNYNTYVFNPKQFEDAPAMVYEIYPGTLRSIHDFEGRSIQPGAGPDNLNIRGPAAHIILRWRFRSPSRVTANGRPVPMGRTREGAMAAFDHAQTSDIRWQ